MKNTKPILFAPEFKYRTPTEPLATMVEPLLAALDDLETTPAMRVDAAAAFLLTILDRASFKDLGIDDDDDDDFSSAEKAVLFFNELIKRTNAKFQVGEMVTIDERFKIKKIAETPSGGIFYHLDGRDEPFAEHELIAV